MYKKNKIIGLIPARSGSKGIKNKNIKLINGQPLIKYTIRQALESEYIDNVFVSTESQKIQKIAISCGANVPFLRPKKYSSDTSKIISAVDFSLEKLKQRGSRYDIVVLLQPTQPLRRSWHIDEAIKKFVDNNFNSLISVNEVNDHPVLIRKIDNSKNIEKIIQSNSTIRRQDFDKFYKINGAIYINWVKDLNSNLSFNDNKKAYIMEKKYDLDIDEYIDLELLELYLRYYNLDL